MFVGVGFKTAHYYASIDMQLNECILKCFLMIQGQSGVGVFHISFSLLCLSDSLWMCRSPILFIKEWVRLMLEGGVGGGCGSDINRQETEAASQVD